MLKVSLALVLLAALAAGPPALASSPVLLALGHRGLIPTATYSLPKTSAAFLTFATSPDQATDGSFPQQDVVSTIELTTPEILAGQWSSVSKLEPGTYYAVIQAVPDSSQCTLPDASTDPSCASGYSNVLQLVVPDPPTRYRADATVQRFAGSVALHFAASPLGREQPYRVCYLTRARARRCLFGTLAGTDWTNAAGVGDTIRASNRGLATSTTFTWYVAGKVVARKHAWG